MIGFGPYCGIDDTCSNWIYNSEPYFAYTSTPYSLSKTLVRSYNRIDLTEPAEVKKGQIVFIYTDVPNLLAIDAFDNSLISDYLTYAGVSTKLKYTQNWRFYLNVLIKDYFYLNYLNISRTYPNLRNQVYGVYNITTQFVNSNVKLNRYFNVTNGKYFFK